MAILPKKCKKRANFRTFFRKINFFKRRFPPFPGQLRTFLKNHSIGLETLYKNPNEGGIVGKVLGTPIFNGTKNTPKRNSSDFGAEKRKNETFDPLFLFFHAKERLFLFPMVFGTCASKFLWMRQKRSKTPPNKLIFHVWGASAPLGGSIALKIIWEMPSEPRKPPTKFEEGGPSKFYLPLKKRCLWKKAC